MDFLDSMVARFSKTIWPWLSLGTCSRCCSSENKILSKLKVSNHLYRRANTASTVLELVLSSAMSNHLCRTGYIAPVSFCFNLSMRQEHHQCAYDCGNWSSVSTNRPKVSAPNRYRTYATMLGTVSYGKSRCLNHVRTSGVANQSVCARSIVGAISLMVVLICCI